MYKSHNNVELFKDKLIQNKICIGTGVTLSDGKRLRARRFEHNEKSYIKK